MSATTPTRELATGRWTCLAPLTDARFAVRNLGLHTVHGRIPVSEAWFEVAPDGRPVRVHAALSLAGIDTGNSRRDRDLRAPGLLGTEQYPTLTFDGGPARRTGHTEWEVPGRLAGRGTVLDLSLQVDASETTAARATFRATAELDRTDLGVRAPALLIGRRVVIEVDAAFAPEPPTGPSIGTPPGHPPE